MSQVFVRLIPDIARLTKLSSGHPAFSLQRNTSAPKRLPVGAGAERLQAADEVLGFRVEAHDRHAIFIAGQLRQQANGAVTQIVRIAGRIFGRTTVIAARGIGPWPTGRHASRVVQHDNDVNPQVRLWSQWSRGAGFYEKIRMC